MRLERVLDAASEPVSLGDVKRHLRITTAEEDDLLRLYIASARQAAEAYIGKTLINSTWRMTVSDFPPSESPIHLYRPPIREVKTLTYKKADGSQVQLDTAALSAAGYSVTRTGLLYPPDAGWPSDADTSRADSIEIVYSAGVDDASDVPEGVKHAILLLVGAADINREDVLIGAPVVEVPLSARRLLDVYAAARV